MIEGSSSERTGGLKICHCSSRRAAKGLSCSSETGWNKSRPQKPFDLLQPGSGPKWCVNERGMSFFFLFCQTRVAVVKLRAFSLTWREIVLSARRGGMAERVLSAKTALAVWVHSRGDVNSPEVNVGWIAAVDAYICRCDGKRQIRRRVCLHGSVRSFWFLYIFSLFPERTCWL